MTTTAADTRTQAPTARQSLPLIARSELVKLTSLRSTWGLLAAGAAFTVLSGVSQAATLIYRAGAEPVPAPGFDAMAVSVNGVSTMAFLVGVLGVLQVTGELTTGLGRSTFATVPRRGRVVVAKAVATALLVAPVVAVTAVVTVAVSQTILSTQGMHAPLLSLDALQAIVGSAGYAVAVGVFGQTFGWLVRSTVGAAFSLLGLLGVLGSLVSLLLPEAVSNDLVPFLPGEAASALMGADASGASLPPSGAAPVTVVWCAIALALGVRLVRRRDV
ncbi:hypothetical protein ACXR8F_10060 [Terrabacter sp. AAH1]